jgi:RNA polymerase subunit RPABC4/transcription elongation factor Spt4
MKYECENCKLQFDSEDPQICPRCSSKKIRRAFDKKKFDNKTPGQVTHLGERVAHSHQSIVGREGKEGWRDFHSTQTKGCFECGGIDFEFNWKHKEKICKKCGAIMPLPRRMA